MDSRSRSGKGEGKRYQEANRSSSKTKDYQKKSKRSEKPIRNTNEDDKKKSDRRTRTPVPTSYDEQSLTGSERDLRILKLLKSLKQKIFSQVVTMRKQDQESSIGIESDSSSTISMPSVKKDERKRISEPKLDGGKVKDTKKRSSGVDKMTNLLNTNDAVFEKSESVDELGSRDIVAIVCLCCAYLIACIDSYSFLNIVENMEKFYELKGNEVIVLHGSLTFTYAMLAPLVGFLGDRMKRKIVMILGLFCWSTVNAGSAFIPAEYFWVFLTLRIMFSAGQCFFCILLHSIIADLLTGNARLKAFSFLYISIPIGGGIGRTCGKIIPMFSGHWQYVLIYTCPASMICLFLISLTLTEPCRGKADGAALVKNTGLCADMKYLFRNKTFLLGTCASLCISIVAGFMKIWVPLFIQKLQLKRNPYTKIENITAIGSLVFALGGIVGIMLQYRLITPLGRASNSLDVIVAGVMSMASAPLIYLLFMFHTFGFLTWTFFFLSAMTLVANWAFKIDLIVSAVIPTRRSLAIGLHEFVSYLFGETPSPYIIGMAGGLLDTTFEMQSLWVQIKAIQSVIVIPCTLCFCGGGAFIINYFYLDEERQELKEWAKSTWIDAFVD